ncbi:MAG: hypothetical protein ACYCWE_11215 [Eubacteriales bacterium]
MNYQYKIQQFIAIRREKLIAIPDDFLIDPNRLNGLTNEEYITAFRYLQETVAAIYDDIITSLEAWGYTLEPYDGSVSPGDYNLSSRERLADVLEAIGTLGLLKNDSLIVSIAAYKEKVKKHKKNQLILEGLQNFGFEIDGTQKGSTEYNISFLDNPHVPAVFKSYMQAATEAMAPTKQTLHCAMKALFGCFFYRLIEDKSKQMYNTIFLVMTDTFTPEARDMCMTLYDEAERLGYNYVSYYNDCHHQISFTKGSKSFLYLMFNFITKEIHTRIIMHYIMTDENIHFIHELPDHLQANFKNSTCTFCGGNKPPDGSCTMRITYDWNGVTTRACAYQSFKFNNLHKKDLPYIIDVFKHEFNIM